YGSSYFKLPKILQWFTGNIGLHHVHHVRPGIPNYNLQQCYDEVPALQAARQITLGASLGALRLSRYDEKNRKLVSFSRVPRAGRRSEEKWKHSRNGRKPGRGGKSSRQKPPAGWNGAMRRQDRRIRSNKIIPPRRHRPARAERSEVKGPARRRRPGRAKAEAARAGRIDAAAVELS